MTYGEATTYIFERHAAFERSGSGAYKPGLERTLALAHAFGDPHRQLACVHIAGTNGKGTTAHTIAAALSAAGYRTGLYTSPHISDFAERIAVDGNYISHEAVVDFVERYRTMGLEGLGASFFELSTVMAFDHFRRELVDVAVVEVGLGGRLDSTNIITPVLSVVTNISLDHTDLLGETIEEIAREKAGIFKRGVPVVAGEADDRVRRVFDREARLAGTDVIYACDRNDIAVRPQSDSSVAVTESPFGAFGTALRGSYQLANARTVLCALDELRGLGYGISDEAVRAAFGNVARTLHGRWEIIDGVLCDTGHNAAAWEHTAAYLAGRGDITVVIGFCADKDVDSIVALLPHNPRYICVQASTPRAIPATELAAKLQARGLDAVAEVSIPAAVEIARSRAGEIFLGGSFYVIADWLKKSCAGD
ncbi:MAG: bifunctional folylpolyglutamate synthase/dihydrofolate synthase [Muribaculaceae bacterium]|nr:bifunctional folylpolyglutamate synthase/dihydrofolate synthase [Muribaculaceae bacterium]